MMKFRALNRPAPRITINVLSMSTPNCVLMTRRVMVPHVSHSPISQNTRASGVSAIEQPGTLAAANQPYGFVVTIQNMPGSTPTQSTAHVTLEQLLHPRAYAARLVIEQVSKQRRRIEEYHFTNGHCEMEDTVSSSSAITFRVTWKALKLRVMRRKSRMAHIMFALSHVIPPMTTGNVGESGVSGVSFCLTSHKKKKNCKIRSCERLLLESCASVYKHTYILTQLKTSLCQVSDRSLTPAVRRVIHKISGKMDCLLCATLL
jgi:hypothetical protein